MMYIFLNKLLKMSVFVVQLRELLRMQFVVEKFFKVFVLLFRIFASARDGRRQCQRAIVAGSAAGAVEASFH